MLKNTKFHNLLFLGIILIIFQSLFQHYDSFKNLFAKYIGYLTPVLYSFFITILLEPIVNFFEKKLKIKRLISILLTTFFLLILICIFLGITIPQISKSIKELYSKLPYMQNEIEKYIVLIFDYLEEKDILILNENLISESVINFIKNNIKSIQNVSISAFWNIVWWGVSITKLLIGFVLAFFILLNQEYFINFYCNILKLIFGEKNKNKIFSFSIKSKKILLSYIWGRIIVSLVVGLVATVIMLISKTPYAVLNGLLIGIGNMIPFIGSTIAGIIAFLLVVLAIPSKIIFLFIAIGVAQFVDGWIVGPKIVSEAVGMSSFWVIVSILICGSIMGPLGMFMGVPIFGMIKLIYIYMLNECEKRSTNEE